MMETDEMLYRSYLNGEDEALRVLIEKYSEKLTLFIYGMVGNMHDAEELMMDSFAILISKNKPFLGRSTFKTWLFAIGRNQARMFLRKRKISAINFDKADFPQDFTPDLYILKNEQNKILFRALSKINPMYREALILSYFEGMGLDELSGVMKISKRRASDLLYRGKASLKEVLKKEGYNFAELG